MRRRVTYCASEFEGLFTELSKVEDPENKYIFHSNVRLSKFPLESHKSQQRRQSVWQSQPQMQRYSVKVDRDT